MKLQKLVFFAHGWHLAFKDEKLIDEQVEAWPFGPVINSLYHKVKVYGSKSIKEPIKDFNDNFEVITPTVSNSDTETIQFLSSIWKAYKKYTGVQLSNMTHVKGSPWHQVVNDPANQPLMKHTDIPPALIKEYFIKLKEQTVAAA